MQASYPLKNRWPGKRPARETATGEVNPKSESSSEAIPEVLRPWQDWVTWDDDQRDCPTQYNRFDKPICSWPSALEVLVDGDGGQFTSSVRVFKEAWVALPGSAKSWPMNVQIGGQVVAVVEHDGVPSVKLLPGLHELTGEFRWSPMPQRITIPKEVGILSLVIEGVPVKVPQWDSDGQVWLKRIQGPPTDKDLLSLQVYRLIEDGVPLWLRTEIELTVSGKSREEQLGWILPIGWEIANVESPIPVAIDNRGVMKAQVRPGKWTVSINAFRTTSPEQITFAPDAKVAVKNQWVGLKTNPRFRVAQIEGIPMVDATQTTFPQKWRNHPVHLWDTSKPFRLIEKMRGMGESTPGGMRINRRMWLDEDGKSMTYHDTITGTQQQAWRFDATAPYQLGAVRIDGEPQLITTHPVSGTTGVEIRNRNLEMEAIGRVERTHPMQATGWLIDADSLNWTLTLPPGWRVFAVLGADEVDGDWLTAWSLLDLFLLLIFSFAVFRLYGLMPGILALLAFGLGYHELGAPRLLWLFPLIPIALLRAVGQTKAKKFLTAWKYVALGCLVLALIPFVAYQTQTVIYPQLEHPGSTYGQRGFLSWFQVTRASMVVQSAEADVLMDLEQLSDLASSNRRGGSSYGRSKGDVNQASRFKPDFSNMMLDPNARIQTGPAQPKWNWNSIRCAWDGPVKQDQQIRLLLISLTQHRLLTVVRLALLMLMVAVLLGQRRWRLRIPKRSTTQTAAMLLIPMATLFLGSGTTTAQIPDEKMLETLRERLLETPDAYPNAADIPSVHLKIEDNQIEMKAVVHAALEVAVPLPGRLPALSPVSVTMDGENEVLVTRRDGYLWVLSPPGVHEFVVNSMLPNSSDWEWTFALKPRSVTVQAEHWKVTGIGPDGVPGSQVFFATEKGASSDQAAYNRNSYHAILAVDRYLEIGLISKVRTVVRSLSPGNAATLELPLLPGERVLSAGREIQDGKIVVSLAASQKQDEWTSELPSGKPIQMTASQTDQWVERWHLDASPVWNVTMKGIQPVYEPDQETLTPVWHPWPGESVLLTLDRPTAVTGDTMTVQTVNHQTRLGSRLVDSSLKLGLVCSLAGDFLIDMDPDAEITSIQVDQRTVPVQRSGSKLVVPVSPGKQTVSIEWKINRPIQSRSASSPVTLPVEASNITTGIATPTSRWVLWASGPLRGPAVRFWTLLTLAVLFAFVLSCLPLSPLRWYEWVLLSIGLTQVHFIPALIVVAWLFLIAWRGKPKDEDVGVLIFNSAQLAIVALTVVSMIVLIVVVSKGLLGSPDMFIMGNGSTQTYLQWFEGRIDRSLPSVSVISVSVWYFRLLMLLWALWLATSLLRWFTWGWQQFSDGGFWKSKPILAVEVAPVRKE